MLILLACTSSEPADSAKSDDSHDSTALNDSGNPADPQHLFSEGSVWFERIEALEPDPSSMQVMAALQDHGWGLGRFQIDFSIEVLEADSSTPRQEFLPTGDFYSPDCDQVPIPVPESGNLEGESGYACEHDGDCHLLVVEQEEQKLYEMWRVDIRGDRFAGGCLAVWDLSQVYPEDGRGDQCTSADAAGYPIAQLLFTADEVAEGEIRHAIRFALPNTIIRDGVFFHPATHATNSEGGGEEAVPYGARLRLKADFDMSRIESESAKVIARALQEYGMFLADGGNVALMGRSDARTENSWDSLGIDSHALDGIEPEDFELMPLGAEVPLTFECERNGY
jgi:serine/threonine-protein kinase